MDKKQVSAWALFDFANSVYPAVMTTAVFPLFFVGVVVGNDAGQGDWWYGRAISLSALIVATSAPLLGAIADRGGARKKLMLLYVGLCLVGVAMMSSLEAGMVVQGFVLFVVANVGFESSLIFYNAYLPDIAPPEKRGWVSGLGFGVGYLGSAIGLVMVIPFAGDQWEVVWFLVAGFFLLFSVPAFLFLPADGKADMTVPKAARWGLTHFKTIVGEVWRLKFAKLPVRILLLHRRRTHHHRLRWAHRDADLRLHPSGYDRALLDRPVLCVDRCLLSGQAHRSLGSQEGVERGACRLDHGEHRGLLRPGFERLLRAGGRRRSWPRLGSVREPKLHGVP